MGAMRNTIAVMNTKGGVGKSTIVLALAETLASYHGKNVLVIDSDAQASVSSMLMTPASLHQLQNAGLTLVDYLVAAVLNNSPVEWPQFVVRGVSDVDDARSVFLFPSDMQLTLFEREVSRESLHARLRATIRKLLNDVRPVFEIVLIDCPPGLSVLTEVMATRGRLPHLADQARLRLVLRAGGLPPVQRAQPRDGVCREPWRAHQHEGQVLHRR